MGPATNCIDHQLDCVDHQLWLLHLDRMAAVWVADVFRVEKLCKTTLSVAPRRPRLRSSGAKVKSLVRSEQDDGDRAYSWRAMQQTKRARVVRRFQAVRFDQLFRGLNVSLPLGRRQRALQKLR